MISAGLLFALITGLILFALLTGRLKRLAKVMDDFKRVGAAKHIGYRIKQGKRSADEIDRLGSTFKEMAKRIENQMEELKQSDELRRELIANVSHDLRTPLATLQGYIETLLIKGSQYTEEERQGYLETAIGHCQRLSKLVSELLELAKLDSSEMRVNFEPFSLPELVQDVVQKFKLRAEEKHIEIISNLEDELPFVNADIALVERALENLIENAIRFTPIDGTITIKLALKKDILAQISDTGPGIPKEELPHIFKRFYHADRSRKGTEGHSGLGLAITQKIIELHQGSIHVTSSPGAGTSFTFSLPVFHPA
jgi:signal transduction histidine kinase